MRESGETIYRSVFSFFTVFPPRTPRLGVSCFVIRPGPVHDFAKAASNATVEGVKS